MEIILHPTPQEIALMCHDIPRGRIITLEHELPYSLELWSLLEATLGKPVITLSSQSLQVTGGWCTCISSGRPNTIKLTADFPVTDTLRAGSITYD